MKIIAYRSTWTTGVVTFGPKVPLFCVPDHDLSSNIPDHIREAIAENPGQNVICRDDEHCCIMGFTPTIK